MAEPKMENKTETRKETTTRRAFLVAAGLIVGGALASLPRWCPPTPMIEYRMADAGVKRDTQPWCPCPPKPDAGVPKPDMKPAPDTLAQKPDSKPQTSTPPAPTVIRCNVNGEVEKVPGKIIEECDPKAEPNGCKKAGQTCTDKCRCKNPAQPGPSKCPDGYADYTNKLGEVPDTLKRAVRQGISSMASKKINDLAIAGKNVGADVSYCSVTRKAEVKLTGDELPKELKDAVIAAIKMKLARAPAEGFNLKFRIAPFEVKSE